MSPSLIPSGAWSSAVGRHSGYSSGSTRSEIEHIIEDVFEEVGPTLLLLFLLLGPNLGPPMVVPIVGLPVGRSGLPGGRRCRRFGRPFGWRRLGCWLRSRLLRFVERPGGSKNPLQFAAVKPDPFAVGADVDLDAVTEARFEGVVAT
jgi:hypothetical protein